MKKKIRLAINVGFGVFLGLTFPEQINSGIDFLMGVDYASLGESAKGLAMKSFELGKSGVDAIMGLINGGAAEEVMTISQ